MSTDDRRRMVAAGLSGDKVTVIPHGVDVSTFSGARATGVRERYDIPEPASAAEPLPTREQLEERVGVVGVIAVGGLLAEDTRQIDDKTEVEKYFNDPKAWSEAHGGVSEGKG